MTNQELTATVPQAVPADDVAQLKRWIEGYVDPDGKRHPGLIELVGELYEELKTRRERREAMIRGLTTGGLLAILGFIINWILGHLK